MATPRLSVFALPAFSYLALFSLYPFLELVRMSFSHVTPANVVSGGWPWVGWDNFRMVLDSQIFYQTSLNTLVFVLIVVIIGLSGGLLAAVLLKSADWYSKSCLALMVFVWAMPPVVLGSLWKFLLLRRGFANVVLEKIHILKSPVLWLTNQHLVLIMVALVNAWAVVPFAALVYRASLLNVPSELYEAAAIDGANRRQQFVSITLPFLKTTTLILGILTTVYAFRSFDFIYVLTSGGPGTTSTTLPFLSYKLSFMIYKFGPGAAVAVVTIFLVIALAPVYTRALTAGER